MYLQKFPNIDWLRTQAKSNFKNKKAVKGQSLTKPGWPSVILHTHSLHTERDNILGPFSLFLNLSGCSRVRMDKQAYQVNSDFYCISNKGQYYDLHIPKNTIAQTFNIHFGEQLFQDVIAVFRKKHHALLAHGRNTDIVNLEILPKLYWKSPVFMQKVKRIYNFCQSNCDDEELEYELLSDLLVYILNQSVDQISEIQHLSALKNSTKSELLRRISIAEDYLNGNAFHTIKLEQLSRVCNLSRFHLLRVFKEIKGCTPQQYLAQLRLRKAKQLLLILDLPVTEIAYTVGFSELSAFTRFFKKQTNLSPNEFRNQISNLG